MKLAQTLNHGYTAEQIEHAVVHHINEFREQGDHSLAILIGPTQSGELLEVGVVFADDGITIELVGHVMRARTKYLSNNKTR